MITLLLLCVPGEPLRRHRQPICQRSSSGCLAKRTVRSATRARNIVVTRLSLKSQIMGYGNLNISFLDVVVPDTYNGYSDLLTGCSSGTLFAATLCWCSKQTRAFAAVAVSIDFFLERGFDWIGAPWLASAEWNPLEEGSLVGHGGFSLRRRSAMQHCCVPRTQRLHANEDVHFVKCLHRASARLSLLLFAVEAYLPAGHARPLGVHKTHGYLFGENRTTINKLCPESAMLWKWYAS